MRINKKPKEKIMLEKKKNYPISANFRSLRVNKNASTEIEQL
jgi:hypothetical protein